MSELPRRFTGDAASSLSAGELASRASGGTSASTQAGVPALTLVSLVLQLALVALVLHQLDMFVPLYRKLIYLSFVAALINHGVPSSRRLQFFAAFTVVSGCAVLGASFNVERLPSWSVTNAVTRGSVLLAFGLMFVAICRLPLRFWTRAALLAAAAGVLALFRGGVVPATGLEVVWIVIASMFMFRVIVYLHDVSTAKSKPTWAATLAFSFVTPNVCAPRFPAIDFKASMRSHYSSSATAIYQRGIQRMTRDSAAPFLSPDLAASEDDGGDGVQRQDAAVVCRDELTALSECLRATPLRDPA